MIPDNSRLEGGLTGPNRETVTVVYDHETGISFHIIASVHKSGDNKYNDPNRIKKLFRDTPPYVFDELCRLGPLEKSLDMLKGIQFAKDHHSRTVALFSAIEHALRCLLLVLRRFRSIGERFEAMIDRILAYDPSRKLDQDARWIDQRKRAASAVGAFIGSI